MAAARIGIGGLHCDACARRVEAQLASLPGVSAARVRRALGLALVLYDPTVATEDDLLAAVARAADGTPQEYHAVVLR